MFLKTVIGKLNKKFQAIKVIVIFPESTRRNLEFTRVKVDDRKYKHNKSRFNFSAIEVIQRIKRTYLKYENISP